MRFAIILLVVLAAGCTVGSFLSQDVFKSWWFITITAFLCLNLLFCNVTRLPKIIKGIKNMERKDEESNASFLKRKIGKMGAWTTHLGVLVLIAGFALGQITMEEHAVYGLPGDNLPVEGTDLVVTVDDFEVGLREDDTVEQYTSKLTVRNLDSGESHETVAAVNHPGSAFGYRIYQNSTGWAADVEVDKDGEFLQKESVCVGEYIAVKDKPELAIYLNAFYPDYVLDPIEGPKTLSGKVNNPAYLYSAYYMGNMLGMNALEKDDVLTIDEYTVKFDNPQSYTLLQIKKDRFSGLAFAGAIITMLGLIMAFYMSPGNKERN